VTALSALFRRELLIAARAGGGAFAIIFLLAIVTLVPFALGPDLALLSRIGPAILWLGALLATLLGLDRLFQADLEEGALDLMRLGDPSLELVIVVKCAAHWFTTCLPLAIAAPVLGPLFALEASSLPGLCLSLLVGTPALTLIGAVGAAVTMTLRRGGLLLSLLVLPLSVPVLIFGVAAAEAARGGPTPFATPLMLLAALSIAALALAPFAAAAALRAADG
jgi:heme exporter protein B